MTAKSTRIGLLGIIPLLAVLAGLPGPALAGEDQTISAFSAWQGRGQAFQTGPDELTFVGSFSGMLYVDTDQGPQDAGLMVCPAMIKVSTTDGSQIGEGHCAIAEKDGGRVYASLACKGVHLVGCQGTLTLTAGTGRFAGITGSGHVSFRSGLHDIAMLPGNTIEENAAGILVVRDLHYKIP
jgi:hypothetical protein